MIEVFTDGACAGNPGDGGWGAIIIKDGKEIELSGGVRDTTNNQMEMMAAIMALEAITEPSDIIMTTDSKYVLDGITKWIFKWSDNGWKTAAGSPVKNYDLWNKLILAVGDHSIDWKWVKGHSGNEYNERADILATNAIIEM